MRQRLLWLLTGLALAVVAIGAALTKLPVPAVISSAVGAVGAMVAGVATTRVAALMKVRDDQRDARLTHLRCDRRGRLPRVRHLNDPIQLGVHPAAVVADVERSPTFVRRDVTERLMSAIVNERFALLVGESTAGKSRAAYEAVRDLLLDHQLVEPSSRDAVKTAVNAMLGLPRAVLWLDDIERFLGEDGITGLEISAILSIKQHCIVATMRSEEYAYFYGGSFSKIDATRSRETIRQGWAVLRLATRIDLPRRWSGDEAQRAWRIEAETHDPRITGALKQIDQVGVAEYLATGPQLVVAWRDAWAPGRHPRAAALILAAVDARRVGIHRAVSLETLSRAHESYLQERGGHRLRPESIDSALEWATTPLYATSSLLIPGTNGNYIAFDYLIDEIERDAVPAGALEAFVEFGSLAELNDIGKSAWYWGRLRQANLAFDRSSVRYVESRVDSGILIGKREGRAARELFLRRSLKELEAELGWNHENAIELRLSLAWSAGYGLSLRRSVCQLRMLKMEAEHSLGVYHRVTLTVRHCLAMRTAGVGETREAAYMFLRIFEDCIEHLDSNEAVTYWAIHGYARCVGVSSTPERAIELLDEVEAWMRARRTPGDQFLKLRSEKARELRNAGRCEQALKAYRSIVIDEERVNGRHHIVTFIASCELVKCMAYFGKYQPAMQMARELLSGHQANCNSQDVHVHELRMNYSTFIGESGDVVEAVRILREMRDVAVESVGEDDESVRLIDYRIRYWAALKQAYSGADAADEFRRLAEDIAISHGVNYEFRRRVLFQVGPAISC